MTYYNEFYRCHTHNKNMNKLKNKLSNIAVNINKIISSQNRSIEDIPIAYIYDVTIHKLPYRAENNHATYYIACNEINEINGINGKSMVEYVCIDSASIKHINMFKNITHLRVYNMYSNIADIMDKIAKSELKDIRCIILHDFDNIMDTKNINSIIAILQRKKKIRRISIVGCDSLKLWRLGSHLPISCGLTIDALEMW